MPRFIFTKNLSDLKNKFLIKRKIRLSDITVKKASGIITVSLIMLGLIYVWQINSLATIGYAMNDLEGNKVDLAKKNQELTIKVTEAKSTGRILQKLEELEMVPVGSISYITPRSGVAIAE